MKAALRHRARVFAMQTLYSWNELHLATPNAPITLDQIIEQGLFHNKDAKYDLDYYKELVEGVILNQTAIEQLIQNKLKNIDVENVSVIELNILRIAVYELLKRNDVPHKVVINEAIEICKRFGLPTGYTIVNGVLDKLAQELR